MGGAGIGFWRSPVCNWWSLDSDLCAVGSDLVTYGYPVKNGSGISEKA